MAPTLPIVDTLRIASPCDASWEAMTGDDRKRFCGRCEKHVYNLPLLSPDELVDLIEATEGKFCGRLYARRDGTVLTADCPVGLAQLARARRRRAVSAGAALAALWLSAGTALLSASWGGASVAPPPPTPSAPTTMMGEPTIVEPAHPPEEPIMMMGDIAMPEEK